MFSVKYIAFLIAAQPALAVQHHLGMGQRQKLGAALEGGAQVEVAQSNTEKKQASGICSLLSFLWFCKAEAETSPQTDTGNADNVAKCKKGNKFSYTFLWFITREPTVTKDAQPDATECEGVAWAKIKAGSWIGPGGEPLSSPSAVTSAGDQGANGGDETRTDVDPKVGAAKASKPPTQP